MSNTIVVNCNFARKLSQINAYNYCILNTIVVNAKICGKFDKNGVYKYRKCRYDSCKRTF